MMRAADMLPWMFLFACACAEPSSDDPDASENHSGQGDMASGGMDMGQVTADDQGSGQPDQGQPPTRDQGSDTPDDGNPQPVADMRVVDGGCDGAGAALCDDFEGAQIDPRYREINFGQPAFTLDTSWSHSGQQSIKVTSMGFTQMLAVEVPASKFYGRVYISSDTPMNAGHNTYINAGEGDGDPNSGEWIRIGEHREQLEINRKSDDKEFLSSGDYNSLEGATQFEANTWYCLEFLFDGPGSEVRVWVEGEEVPKLHATDWTANYQTFKFGYERYHGPDKTLWYDDLALGTERIGCL